MEVPAGQQLHYLLLALPAMKRLGILNCVVTPQGAATAQSAAAAALALGLTVIREETTDDRPELVEEGLKALVRRGGVEALFIPHDPVLSESKNLGFICQRARRARIPVMVISRSSVETGALLAYHADFIESGRQAGQQAARLLAGAQINTVSP
jgi:putative ABC transport system substrate-binding protein